MIKVIKVLMIVEKQHRQLSDMEFGRELEGAAS